MERFIFENLPGSGFTRENKKFKPKGDDNWRNNGYLGKFDQNHIVDLVQEHFKDEKNVDIESLKVRKWGFYYYPESCLSVLE